MIKCTLGIMLLLNLYYLAQAEDKFFFFIIPSYNNAEKFHNGRSLVEMNLESIFAQDYDNYHIIYCDDASTDNTETVVKNCCIKHNKEAKLTYIKNSYNRKAPYNIYNSIHMYCPDTSIAILVDGDDWLTPQTNILTLLNQEYQDPNVWMTYGEFLVLSSPDGSHDVTRYDYQTIERNNFRTNHYYFLPLRTCYAKLFKHIKLTDYLYDNAFFQFTGDLQTGVSLLELAGHHSRYISTPFYVYNNILNTNDNAINPLKQMFFDFFIRNKEKYEPLDNLFETPDISYGHISFVNHTTHLSVLKDQCHIIESIIPIKATAFCLSENNQHLRIAGLEEEIIPSCSAFSWIPYETTQNIKKQLLYFIEDNNQVGYYILSETGTITPNIVNFLPEMMVCSDMCIIGEMQAPHPTQGFCHKYPHLFFATLHEITSYINITKSSFLIIKKSLLKKCLEQSQWINGSYLSFLAALENTYSDHYITCVPVNI